MVCAEKPSMTFFPEKAAMASGSEPERDWAFTLDMSIIISPILSTGSVSKAPIITPFVTGHFDQSDVPSRARCQEVANLMCRLGENLKTVEK